MLSALKKPGEVAAEVIMLRLIHPESFFLVEGDSDSLFWQRFKHETCELINAGSKASVSGAIEILDRREFRGALGLVDADLDRLEEVSRTSSNLVTSEVHDLECLLLRSRAFDGLLVEMADQERLRALERAEERSIRECLLARGLLHGRLRWLAARSGWGPDFRGSLRLSRFVLQETWRLDEEALLDQAADQGCPVVRQELRTALSQLGPVDPWSLCRGHDLIDVLRIGLEGSFGRRGMQFGRDALSRALRLAFDREELGGEGTVRQIRDWEDRNRPFEILA